MAVHGRPLGCITDGHENYRLVTSRLNLRHEVVNYSSGFKSPDGWTTNMIEGTWSEFKTWWRKSRGFRSWRNTGKMVETWELARNRDL